MPSKLPSDRKLPDWRDTLPAGATFHLDTAEGMGMALRYVHMELQTRGMNTKSRVFLQADMRDMVDRWLRGETREADKARVAKLVARSYNQART